MVATATGVVVCQLHFTGLPTLLVSCDSAIVLLLYCASSLLCSFSIVLLRYCASSLLCIFAIVHLRYCAASLLCCFAIVLLRYCDLRYCASSHSPPPSPSPSPSPLPSPSPSSASRLHYKHAPSFFSIKEKDKKLFVLC